MSVGNVDYRVRIVEDCELAGKPWLFVCGESSATFFLTRTAALDEDELTAAWATFRHMAEGELETCVAGRQSIAI